MSEEELTGITWVTKKGEHMDIGNMSDEHLINAYKYVIRHWPWRETFIVPLAKEITLRMLPWYGGK